MRRQVLNQLILSIGMMGAIGLFISAAGREQSMQFGEAFRSRNIRVARVLSSQWCRCLDTAALMNLANVEPFPVLNSFFNRPLAD